MLKGGDAPSIDILYDTYGGVILEHCSRILGDAAEAEDALQDTFIKANDALATFELKKGYSSWLIRIATNVCLNILRTRRRKPYLLDEQLDTHPDQSSEADQIFAIRQILKKLAATLDERDLQLIVDHFVVEMDQGQLATSYGISRRAVAKRLRKIRDRVGHLWPEVISNV